MNMVFRHVMKVAKEKWIKTGHNDHELAKSAQRLRINLPEVPQNLATSQLNASLSVLSTTSHTALVR